MGAIYIGSTTNVKLRFNYYRRLKCKQQIKLYRSFIKYGVFNHIFIIIDECPDNLKLKVERVYGIVFNVLDRSNLNLKIPGKDKFYKSFSDETRAKMSATRTGKSLSDETKKRMSISKKGEPKSDETRLKLSIANRGKGGRISFLGKKHSEETKRIISQNNIGKHFKKSKHVKRTCNQPTDRV